MNNNYHPKNSFLQEYLARGYSYQATDLAGLDELMCKERVTGYIGFDCTATSLHVGSLMQIMILRLLERHGHRPIVIVGGATSKIGDPSFKDEARKMLTEEDVERNKEGIKATLRKFINFDGDNGAIMVDNADWFRDVKYIDFLRDYGSLISVNRMIGMESVKSRLEREQSLSFLEFNYMMLQGVDFVELNRKHNCRLQFGGSDQWGNIVVGIELNRRVGLPEVFGLTSPLLTTSSGQKMGKTVSGAVWLDEDMLSPYHYWQFWRNTEDADVIKFLRLFTDLPLEEIARLEKLSGSEINEAKKILANEATKLCHGAKASEEAADSAQALFEQGMVAANLPTIEISRSELESGIIITKLLQLAGLVTSNSEARKLIRSNGVRINDEVVSDELMLCNNSQAVHEGAIKLSAGKKRHILVKGI